MKRTLYFVAGVAAGYVLGARAGRQRYEQLRDLAKRFSERPAVQEAAGIVQAKADELGNVAKRKVRSKMGLSNGVGHKPVVPPPPASAAIQP
ncbi:MAG: hypothetical protein HOQ05_03590 [Corynebacteriales bacterium]|nr:hypothetical protein [Mycobacteriales bacterium]